MMHAKTSLVGLVMLALCTTAQPAQAQSDIVDVNRLYARAMAMADDGDLTGAIRRLKSILDVDPYWGQVHWQIGYLAWQIGAVTDCVVHSTRYLALEPDARDTDRVLGRIERCQRGIDQPATIEVTATSPERAAIYLNGVLMGEGSLPPITLPAGEYHLAYTAMDHHPSEESVTLAAGETHALSAELTMLTFYGQLSVESSIEGASVLLDGRLLGASPISEPLELETGRYLVEVVAAGHHPWRRRVEVRREGHAYVDARLLDEAVDLSQFQR